MKITTLCYLEKNDKYLMLHRTKKKNDQSKGKWLGAGGKLEMGESPEECMIREVKEETGYEVLDYEFKGIVTFISDCYEDECMFIYVSDNFRGDLISCEEGDFSWIEKEHIFDLNLWEGDCIFLKKIVNNEPFFSMKFVYKGEKLSEYKVYQ